MEIKFYTIVFIDVITLTNNNIDIKIIRERKEKLINDIISNYSWILIKKIWEWYMLTFNSPTLALFSLINFKSNLIDERVSIKIWVHTWEVSYQSDYFFWSNNNVTDVFWTNVNLSARIKSKTEKGCIYVSKETIDYLAENVFNFNYIWLFKYKWIKNKVSIYELKWVINNADVNNYKNNISWTIVSTDIKWYTEKVSTQNSKELDIFINNLAKIIVPITERYKWKIIKTIWDAYIIYFNCVKDALIATNIIQNKIKKFNKETNNKNLIFNIRIWVDCWEIIIQDWEYIWNTIELSQFIEQSWKEWEIFFSEKSVINLNKDKNLFTKTGNIVFKKNKTFNINILNKHINNQYIYFFTIFLF